VRRSISAMTTYFRAFPSMQKNAAMKGGMAGRKARSTGVTGEVIADLDDLKVIVQI